MLTLPVTETAKFDGLNDATPVIELVAIGRLGDEPVEPVAPAGPVGPIGPVDPIDVD